MQLRLDMQIRSMIKAMVEVIIPAIDTSNELAMQQSQLLLAHLALIYRRSPMQYRADRDELARLTSFAAELNSKAVEPDVALADAVDEGAGVLDRARADPSELLAASRKLTEALDQTIRSAFEDGDCSLQHDVRSITLAMSKEQLLRDRSWLITQGWEPDPASVPDIEALLSAIPACAA